MNSCPPLTGTLCGARHARRGVDSAPPSVLATLARTWRRASRDGIREALRHRQHRRQGSAGAWERRRGVAPLACRMPCWAERAVRGRTCHAGPNWSFLRIVLDERGPRNRLTQPLCIFAFSAGRPRASPRPTVLLGDRAAVPCRPVTCPERGPTAHGTIRTPHRSSEPRVVLPGPPLAGTDTGTNDTARGVVTRRTGERTPELTTPEPAPDLRRGPGTVRAESSPTTCRACRGHPCSGRGPPSRGRGSPAGRRK